MGSIVPSSGKPPKNIYEQGWVSAVQLAEAVRHGHALPTQATSLVLGQGEVYHCGTTSHLAAYYGLDEVSYSTGGIVAGSTWKGMAATGAASMIWSSRNRNRAQREAAAQWRSLGEVPLHLTNHRMVVGIDGGLESLWLNGGITMFDPAFDQYAMHLQADGGWPLLFEGPAVPYVAVILHILLRGEVPALQYG